MKKIKLLGIAPYEELNNSMNVVGKQFENVHVDIFTADLIEGRRLASSLYQSGYDAIISRGGTANLIRQAVSIPVIDVSISIYDILGAIRLAENYTKNFAIVGYASITDKAHLLCEILGYNIEIHTLADGMDPGEVLDTLVKKKYEMILCDAITNRLAIMKSLNTILITSGFESVKHAYEEAISIAEYLKEVKQEKEILIEGIQSLKLNYFIFDEDFQVLFSNLSTPITQHLLKSLQIKKDLQAENQFYSSINNQFYSLYIQHFFVNQTLYYSCRVDEHLAPNLTNKLGITYKKRSEVAEIFTTKLLFTQFIPEQAKQELQKAQNYYTTFFIFGQIGTAKKNIAYLSYLNQKKNTNYLITVDCQLLPEKIWKFLVNPTNGPFVDTNNTLLFEHVDQLSFADLERLISLIESTNLAKSNNLIFIYDITNESSDRNKYQQLLTTLDCARIYAPSIKERKNELSIITTLLLNKINIQCNKEIIGFHPKALEDFLAFDWPGNFNQLQSAIKELIINAPTHYISEHQVTELLNKEQLLQNLSKVKSKNISISKTTTTKTQLTLFDYTKEIILNVLEQNNGNQTKTAEQLGISRTTLWRYLKN